jgi:signal transduction histidine kinase/DNA-binding response OmpR family regulator
MKCRLYFWYKVVFFLTHILAPACLFADKPVHTHVFRDEVQKKVFFHDSLYVFLDDERQYDIWDIIHSDELEFQRPVTALQPRPPFAVWSKLILRNEGKTARHEYFSFCLDADSSWVYTIKDGKIVDERFTGMALRPSEKSIPSMYHYTPVSIGAGEEKVFYFRLVFTKNIGAEHFTHISIQPGKPLLHRHFNDYILHSLYAGIMLFFCVFSLFMFRLFREKIFAWFASLTFFFALYFTHLHGMIHAFITNWFSYHDISLGHIIISGLVLSLFLFVNGYVRMKERLPKFYFFYAVFTLLLIGYAHAARMLGIAPMALLVSHNIAMAVWAFFLLIPVVYLAIKKDKEARVLLVSIGMLFLGAVLFLISFDNANPSGSWMRHGFQSGSIVFAGILFYGLFDKVNTIRSEQRRMEELDRIKSNFFANISHEFRTPLTLMMGPLQEVLNNTDDPKKRRLLEMSRRNAVRQLQLVNQLLDLSKLDAGKMELQAGQEDFIPFLKGVAHAYQSLAAQKNIALKIVCPEGAMPLYFNRDKMEIICYNLLSNAFKFTPSGGQVSVVLKKKKGRAVVTVSDTGAGIAAQKLPHIFDRFFQADARKNEEPAGSGIGLALVRELVELHGGAIAVASQEGQGTSFTLEFPLGKDHLPPVAVTAPPSPRPAISLPEFLPPVPPDPAPEVLPSEPAADGAPHLLIVEDNTDVRAFIRLRLESSFRVTEATHGQEGIEMAIDLMPDLIISDVMMPGKNGYEVCQTLKTDLRTCHIPIILLTAKAAQTEKLEGLETGADDYLTKPFDSVELEVRALNLVRLRRQLRERFASSVSLRPSEVTTNSLDQTFLENALQIVEANLDNEQFSIEVLAREIGMSKPNLNRKLRALVNQSTNQFIQSVRLQRAADLLRQQAGTVSEIAFQTGFGSTAYFVKCFKEQFGETPGVFLKKE